MKITLRSEKKKSGWQIVNSIILALHLVFPVWLMAWMYTSAISGVLLIIAVVSALALGVVYKEVQRKQKGKKLLIAARVIAIGACVVYYLPMVVLMNFVETKWMYPLKRLDYTFGVYGGNAAYYQRLLPGTLPKVCEDYSFRTQGSMIAQDYHPSSYLMFHTDTVTLDEYAAYYETLDCSRIVNSEYTEGKFSWFCGQMRMEKYFQDDLSNAVLYWFGDYYPKGVLLNYDTGLVAVLT